MKLREGGQDCATSVLFSLDSEALESCD